MKNQIIAASRAVSFWTLIIGGVYTGVITLIAATLFPFQAGGSLISSEDDGKIVGSSLVGQKFSRPEYFWSRPSAANYATLPSGASNKSMTSADFRSAVEERRAFWAEQAPRRSPPVELLTASASGLDPHLPPAALRIQLPRVARARDLSREQIARLDGWIDAMTERSPLGAGGERVNVLLLNLRLERWAR